MPGIGGAGQFAAMLKAKAAGKAKPEVAAKGKKPGPPMKKAGKSKGGKASLGYFGA